MMGKKDELAQIMAEIEELKRAPIVQVKILANTGYHIHRQHSELTMCLPSS